MTTIINTTMNTDRVETNVLFKPEAKLQKLSVDQSSPHDSLSK